MLFNLDSIKKSSLYSRWEAYELEQDSSHSNIPIIFGRNLPPWFFSWYSLGSIDSYETERYGYPRFSTYSRACSNPAPNNDEGQGVTGYCIIHQPFNGGWTCNSLYYSDGGYEAGTGSKLIALDYEHKNIQFPIVAEFKNLTLNAGDVFKPIPFNGCGGVFFIKVNDTLTFNGGHIDLTGAGIPTSQESYRRLAAQESNAALDSGTQIGEENKQCVDYFPLNVGDGACFIFAKNIRVTNSASRIGNPNSKGVANCRGAADDSKTPSGTTNIGGSNIFIACETFQGFTPDLISKYRTGSANDGLGKGLARAFIHVENKNQCDVPQDRRLYYLDTQATAPKLHLRKNGAVEDIQLSDTKSGNAVGIKTADGIFYANLVDPSDANASSLRVRLNNTTYALANS